MGDYTYFTGTIYKMKPRKLLEAEQQIFDINTGGWGQPEKHLALGEPFNIEEARCGSVEEWASALIELSPPAVWEMHEDPKYEWLGTYAAYHPKLGLFIGECDANGNVVVNEQQLLDTAVLGVPMLSKVFPTAWRAEFEKFKVVTMTIDNPAQLGV